MAVDFLTTDRWEGRVNRETRVPHPSWKQIQEAIEALDGQAHTTVVIVGSESAGGSLTVAGAWDDRYLVNGTLDDYDFFSLVDEDQDAAPVPLTVGGQEGEFPGNQRVPRDWAMRAAKGYYESQELDAELPWVSDY